MVHVPIIHGLTKKKSVGRDYNPDLMNPDIFWVGWMIQRLVNRDSYGKDSAFPHCAVDFNRTLMLGNDAVGCG